MGNLENDWPRRCRLACFYSMKNTRRDFFAVLGRRFHEKGKKVKFWFHIRNLVEHETYSSGLLWAFSTNRCIVLSLYRKSCDHKIMRYQSPFV